MGRVVLLRYPCWGCCADEHGDREDQLLLQRSDEEREALLLQRAIRPQMPLPARATLWFLDGNGAPPLLAVPSPYSLLFEMSREERMRQATQDWS